MEFKVAIESVYLNARSENQSTEELFRLLSANAKKAELAYQENNHKESISTLQETMRLAMIAFKKFDIDLDSFLLQNAVGMDPELERTMYIYTDRVEIVVDNKVKGGWALWSSEDLVEAFKVAQEFNCKVIKEEIEAPKVR